MILPRLSKEKSNFEVEESTKEFIEEYANEGLRTLLLCKRDLSHKEYHEWNLKFVEAI